MTSSPITETSGFLQATILQPVIAHEQNKKHYSFYSYFSPNKWNSTGFVILYNLPNKINRNPYLKWAKAVIAAMLAQSAIFPPLSKTWRSTLTCQTFKGVKQDIPWCHLLTYCYFTRKMEFKNHDDDPFCFDPPKTSLMINKTLFPAVCGSGFLACLCGERKKHLVLYKN